MHYSFRRGESAQDLENDGFTLQLRPVLEDGVDDLEELVALQEARIVLLEVLDEIVQDEVGACTVDDRLIREPAPKTNRHGRKRIAFFLVIDELLMTKRAGVPKSTTVATLSDREGSSIR